MISELADGYIEAKYYGSRLGRKICKITTHHMSAVQTGKKCAEYFRTINRKASANYCIGVDGDLYGSVPEEYRAYTSSSFDNDSQAITIECSNSSLNYPYPISEATWNTLVELCVDICFRYGFKLEFNGNPSGSLTMHRWFANTDCPGDYLASKFDELEQEVNQRLEAKLNLTIESIMDLDLYRSLYVDLQQAFKPDDTEGLYNHLIKDGVKEGRRFSYVYDPKYYRQYGDLWVFGNDYWKYLNHFLNDGIPESRQACKEFSVKYYKDKNGDLKKFDNKALVRHFIMYGINEWRKTSPDFNVEKYASYYKDLRDAFGKESKLYYKHYITDGQYENRKCK